MAHFAPPPATTPLCLMLTLTKTFAITTEDGALNRAVESQCGPWGISLHRPPVGNQFFIEISFCVPQTSDLAPLTVLAQDVFVMCHGK